MLYWIDVVRQFYISRAIWEIMGSPRFAKTIKKVLAISLLLASPEKAYIFTDLQFIDFVVLCLES